MVLFPRIAALSGSLTGLLSLDALAIGWVHFAAVMGAAAVLAGVPCYLAARLPADWCGDTGINQRVLALFLLGLSGGMLLNGLVLAAVLGVHGAALLAAALGAGLGLIGLWSRTRRSAALVEKDSSLPPSGNVAVSLRDTAPSCGATRPLRNRIPHLTEHFRRR
jgi:hypothetical protein